MILRMDYNLQVCSKSEHGKQTDIYFNNLHLFEKERKSLRTCNRLIQRGWGNLGMLVKGSLRSKLEVGNKIYK